MEIKIATISSEYLEELYRNDQQAGGTEEIVSQFDMRANETIDRYLDINNSHRFKIREFLVVDDSTNRCPYLVMLLLFRAGLHKEAIWFAS